MTTVEYLGKRLQRQPSAEEIWGMINLKRILELPLYADEILASITEGQQFARYGWHKGEALYCHRGMFYFFEKFFPNNPQGRAEFLMKAKTEGSPEQNCLGNSANLDLILEFAERLGLSRRQEHLKILGNKKAFEFVLHTKRSWDHMSQHIGSYECSEDDHDLLQSYYWSQLRRARRLVTTEDVSAWHDFVGKLIRTIKDNLTLDLAPESPFVETQYYHDWCRIDDFHLEGKVYKFSIRLASTLDELVSWGAELCNCLGTRDKSATLFAIYDHDLDKLMGAFQVSSRELEICESEAWDGKNKNDFDYAYPGLEDHLLECLFNALKNECEGATIEKQPTEVPHQNQGT